MLIGVRGILLIGARDILLIGVRGILLIGVRGIMDHGLVDRGGRKNVIRALQSFSLRARS